MWMKVDDGLHTHRKTRAVTKSHAAKTRDAAPMGLWVLAGSWAGQNGTDGWVPEDELDRWDSDWQSLAARLVKAGYWWPVERDGESGYGFTDWHDYNDPADSASKAGTYGNHVRWHVNEKRVDPECAHCPKEPDGPEDHPDIAPESGGDRGAIGGDPHPTSGGESQNASGAIALPDPNPTRPEPEPEPLSREIARRDDHEPTAQSFVAEWLEHCPDRPPGRVIGRVAKELKTMLTEGIDPARVRAGLAEWNARGLHPSSLPSVVHELSTPQRRPGRQKETDDLFSRAAVRMGVINGGQQ